MGLLCNGHWIFGQPTATFALSRLSNIERLQHSGIFYSDCQAHSWAFSYRLHYAFHLPTMIWLDEGNTKSLPFWKVGIACRLRKQEKSEALARGFSSWRLELGDFSKPSYQAWLIIMPANPWRLWCYSHSKLMHLSPGNKFCRCSSQSLTLEDAPLSTSY